MEQNISEFLDEKLKELPIWIIEKSVPLLKEFVGDRVAIEIKELYSKDSDEWWAGYHHGWGTAIRNYLRQNVCHDRELPTENWDDVYIQLVELALELR